MCNYRLQYVPQLYNSIHHRSNNSFCTVFRKDFHFWDHCGVPLFRLNFLDICNKQLLIVKLQQLMQFISHTCPTNFWKSLMIMKKISVTFIYKTHTMYQIQTHTKFNQTESCIRSQAHFLVESRMDDLSVIWGVRLDAQTLVLLLLLELNSPCLPHRQLLLGWQRLIPSENRPRWMGNMGYQFQVNKHCPYPLHYIPNWI